MGNEVKITVERYTDLIQKEQKYYQYRKALIENTTNNQITKILTTIESKNLFELYDEMKENKEGE